MCGNEEFVKKCDGKFSSGRWFGRPRRSWGYNVKIEHAEMACENGRGMGQCQDAVFVEYSVYHLG